MSGLPMQTVEILGIVSEGAPFTHFDWEEYPLRQCVRFPSLIWSNLSSNSLETSQTRLPELPILILKLPVDKGPPGRADCKLANKHCWKQIPPSTTAKETNTKPVPNRNCSNQEFATMGYLLQKNTRGSSTNNASSPTFWAQLKITGRSPTSTHRHSTCRWELDRFVFFVRKSPVSCLIVPKVQSVQTDLDGVWKLAKAM